MTPIRISVLVAFCFLLSPLRAQEIDTYRILNLTINTSGPSELRLNRGRLVWKELDGNNDFVLRYFSGAEIVTLDSALAEVTQALDGDYILWNTSAKVVKVFNIRTWETDTVSVDAYYPSRLLSVSTSNGLAAFAADKLGGGSEIRMRNLAAGTDSIFSSALWNRDPSVSMGQLAWSAGSAEDTLSPSSISFYDGTGTRTISDTNTVPNRSPILKDAGIVWLQVGSRPRVKAFVGDSLFTLAEAGLQSVVAGYDISNGTAVAAVTDTVNVVSTIRIFRPSIGAVTVLTDSNVIQPPRIDNGLVVWVSGTGGERVMKQYSVSGEATSELGIADFPVIDDDHIAWTLGDAVMLRVPVTYERLTNDAVNGWAQRRFKTIGSEAILWGNFADGTLPQRTNPRMFYAGAGGVVQLTDSLVYRDFEMVNSGYAVWRHDFNQLFVYDGVNPPVKVLDTLQVENMYVADSSIGFHGFGLNVGNSQNQAFVYRIATGDLIQLTNDPETNDSSNATTLVDGDDAVWYRSEGEETMLMYYDGTSSSRLTDSLVGFKFSFVDGVIAWSERRNGVYQIMMKDVSAGGTVQVTDGTQDAVDPITDGSAIAWFETSPPILVYYEIGTGRKSKVTRLTPPIVHWMWMSNGRIAWSQGNEVRVFDGSTISQLTGSGDFTPNVETYVDNEFVVWKQQSNNPGIPALGDIFRGKLRSFASFDAVNPAGAAPLEVTFLNRSWQGARTWLWDFGDGMSSSEENPVHSYTNPGLYSVTLTVSGLTGESVEKKWSLVRVMSATGVTGETSPVPAGFALDQNYPNPFNPSTNINFRLKASGFTLLRVFDLLGRQVAVLVNEELKSGSHEVTWDATGFPSGVYFCRIEAGGFVQMRKMVVIR